MPCRPTSLQPGAVTVTRSYSRRTLPPSSSTPSSVCICKSDHLSIYQISFLSLFSAPDLKTELFFPRDATTVALFFLHEKGKGRASAFGFISLFAVVGDLFFLSFFLSRSCSCFLSILGCRWRGARGRGSALGSMHSCMHSFFLFIPFPWVGLEGFFFHRDRERERERERAKVMGKREREGGA